MSARPIATSTISFGLVSLPVKLYSTGESSARVRFNWINRDTGSRVKQQYVDSQTGDLVPREDMIKGYEFAKNQYVTFEPEELKAIEAQSTEAIEITEFVPADDIERIFLDKAYFLGLPRGGLGPTGSCPRRSAIRVGPPSPNTRPGESSTWS